MAKAALNFPIPHPFSASLGNYSTYTLEDGTLVVRGKGGGSEEQLKTDPAYQTYRDYGKEHGGASTAASALGKAMVSLKHLGSLYLHSRLTTLIKTLYDQDTSNPVGMRSIVFSKDTYLLEGLQLNLKINFDSIITSPIDFTIDRATHTAMVVLPPLSPGKNFYSQWDYPFFRIIINLGIIRDMEFIKGIGYKPVLEDIKGYTESSVSEWYQSTSKVIGHELGLTIKDPVFDESCHLVLSIGIEFGTPRDGKIQAVKRAGCAKILGLG